MSEIIKIRFVIHRHEALRAGLHYDFRFEKPENPNKLYSFAIKTLDFETGKKTPMIDGGEHEHSWLDVEHKEIEDGEYGAGVITKIDGGVLDVNPDFEKGKKYSFSANSKYLKGEFTIFRISDSKIWEIYKQ
ncbi:MAG: DNA polymerase ligase N-terminal domain-containing protein [Methanolobus sp.]|nr:DNA polymerase ligase N-terminal domain-containing protein [Methanolobus sp.]